MFIWEMSPPHRAFKSAQRGEERWSSDCGFIGEEERFFSVRGSLILRRKPAGNGVRTEPGKKGHLKVIISNKTKASVSLCFISSLKKTRRTEGQAPHTK